MKAAAARAWANWGSESSGRAGVGVVAVSFGAAFDFDFDFLDLALVSAESATVTSLSPPAFRFVDPVPAVLVEAGASVAVAIRGILGVGDSASTPNTAFIFEYASSQSITINELRSDEGTQCRVHTFLFGFLFIFQ